MSAQEDLERWERANRFARGASDQVTQPSHYTSGEVETIDAIWATGHGEGFCVGNAIKYLSRAGKKDGNSYEQDVRKAKFYLEFLLHKKFGHADPRVGPAE